MGKQVREIRVKDLICYYYLTLTGIICLTIGFILAQVLIAVLWVKLVLVPVYLVFMYFTCKYHVIGCVLMYKAYAPLEIRAKCRFEPSCSTYMIMAVRKYGLFKGVIKGIKRVKRCKPPNGGVDYP